MTNMLKVTTKEITNTINQHGHLLWSLLSRLRDVMSYVHLRFHRIGGGALLPCTIFLWILDGELWVEALDRFSEVVVYQWRGLWYNKGRDFCLRVLLVYLIFSYISLFSYHLQSEGSGVGIIRFERDGADECSLYGQFGYDDFGWLHMWSRVTGCK